MIHQHRSFNLTSGWSLGKISDMLVTFSSLTACTAWLVTRNSDGALFILANDAFSPDGAQEYAILRVMDHPTPHTWVVKQTESVTASWVQPPTRLLSVLAEAIESPCFYGSEFTLYAPADEDHRCAHCA